MWRKLKGSDTITQSFLARSLYEKDSFEIVYNTEWKCWALKDNPAILVSVSEIWEEEK